MTALYQALSERSPISQSEMDLFLGKWKAAEYPKNHLLLTAGQVSDHFFFLEKGAIRIFYYKAGKEITEWLVVDRGFFFSITSFFQRIPSRLIIQTLEPSTVWAIHHDALMDLCNYHLGIARVWRELLTRSLIYSQVRMDAIQFESAEQRYQKLVQARPEIVQRVPLGYIASYLGVTQETLSRIRAGEK
jgi:CRP-like cAMP-binding protein